MKVTSAEEGACGVCTDEGSGTSRRRLVDAMQGYTPLKEDAAESDVRLVSGGGC